MARDWTGNSKTAYSILGASNHSEDDRQIDDYYATDPKALELFLNKITDDNIILNKNIWECACGEGHLSKVLENAHYNVYSTDLIYRGFGWGGINFLDVKDKWHGDILTNPPYKYAKEFVQKAIDIIDDSNHAIMFLKIQFLEGQERKKLFEKYPPKYVYVNSKRQVCAKNGRFDVDSNSTGTAICYCWYIWEKGFTGEPTIRWL